jgi:4-oxalocrotonate tautomerase
MPVITVEIFRGRTLDQRRQFARDVTEAAASAFGVAPQTVRITFREMERADLSIGGELLIDRDARQAGE